MSTSIEHSSLMSINRYERETKRMTFSEMERQTDMWTVGWRGWQSEKGKRWGNRGMQRVDERDRDRDTELQRNRELGRTRQKVSKMERQRERVTETHGKDS